VRYGNSFLSDPKVIALSIIIVILFSLLSYSFPSALALDISGSIADDNLQGTTEQDYIKGLKGNDFIQGLAGADSLYGGAGNDTLDGGKGNDTLLGGSGADKLTGGPGADSFNCGSGKDTILDFSYEQGDTKQDNCENVFSNSLIAWYGARDRDQEESGAFGRLHNAGFNPEYRNRSVTDLSGSNTVMPKLVIMDWPDYQPKFSKDEIRELTDYVHRGGHLILAMDNDYYYCNPPSSCSMEVVKHFGFAFSGNIQYDGVLVPAKGKSNHPIWKTPNTVTSFSHWCCDGYVSEILDEDNVKVLGRIQGSATSVTSYDGAATVTNVAVIVVNDNPEFNGGKVLGTGRDMFIGHDETGTDDFTMFDNIIKFMTK
jgi:hypothetical protein